MTKKFLWMEQREIFYFEYFRKDVFVSIHEARRGFEVGCKFLITGSLKRKLFLLTIGFTDFRALSIYISLI